MKITGSAIDRFLDEPSGSIVAALIYGPDRGLVSERCRRLGLSVVDDLSDPFSVVEVTSSTIREDGARLSDEARALSFGGGKRLVRLRNGTDSATGVISEYLQDPASGAVIIVDAEDLGPRSSLRKLFEGHDQAAAVPCYTVEGHELEQTIQGILNQFGVSADRDALSMLSGNLGADRGLVRQELEKLALFVGSGNQATVSDVADCLVDSAGVSLDRLSFAVGDGNAESADTLLQSAVAEGISEIAVIRALQRHFQRLEWVVSQSEKGNSAASLMGGLRPPVFFKFKGRFEQQTRRWSQVGLRRALDILVEAEIACKSTGTPSALVCGRAVLALCRPR